MISETDLQRFVHAQENLYSQVLRELQNGKKTSHWMWFIFPQVAGLGSSSTSKYYSIKSIAEAKEYINHPVLGKRLMECSNIILQVEGRSVDDIFGSPDNIKLQSSMTLFSFIIPEETAFSDVLKKYFNNNKDQKTLSILKSMNSDCKE